jgi:hypothetical protein
MTSPEFGKEWDKFSVQIKDAEDRIDRYNREVMEATIDEVDEVSTEGIAEAKEVLASAWMVYGRN